MRFRSHSRSRLELEILEERRQLSGTTSLAPTGIAPAPSDVPEQTAHPLDSTAIRNDGGDQTATTSGSENQQASSDSAENSRANPNFTQPTETDSPDNASSSTSSTQLSPPSNESDGENSRLSGSDDQTDRQGNVAPTPSPTEDTTGQNQVDSQETPAQTVQPPPPAPQNANQPQAPSTSSPNLESSDPDNSDNGLSSPERQPTAVASSPTAENQNQTSTVATNSPLTAGQEQKLASVTSGATTAVQPPSPAQGSVSTVFLRESTNSKPEQSGLPGSVLAIAATPPTLGSTAGVRLPSEAGPVASESDRGDVPPTAVVLAAGNESPNCDGQAALDQVWQECQPLGAGLLPGGLALDGAAVQAGVQSFLARLDQIGSALWHAPTGPNLYWSLLTTAAVVSIAEVVRRQRGPSRQPALGWTGDPLFCWYPRPEQASTEEHS